MVRFFIALSLALFGHYYIFQYSLDLGFETQPELISDSSVSVTLNDSLVNQPNEAIETESSSVPKPEPVLKPALPPPTPIKEPSPDVKKDHVKKPIKLQKTHKKTKKTLEPPTPEEVCESAPAKNDSSVENVSIQTQQEQQTENQKTSDKSLVSQGLEAKQSASSVIKARPLYQYNPKPEYPSMARQRGWEGIVSLLVEVKVSGDVASVRLQDSCGYKILDKSAIRAVKSWRFIPGTRDGFQVQSTVMIPVHFKLY